MNNTQQAPVFDASALTERAMLVSLTIKKPGNSKQDKDASSEITADRHAKEGSARVNKTLFDKEAVQSFSKPASAARQLLTDMTLPWGQRGIRILLAENYFALMKRIEPLESAFWSAVDKFKGRREEHIEESRKALGSLFNEDDYPSAEELEAGFEFQLKFMPLTDASDWRVKLGAEDEERMKARIEEQLRASISEASREPWQRIQQAVSALATRLEARAAQEEDDSREGRPTPLKSALFDNLRELSEALPGLNVTQDPALNKMAEEIGKLVSDTTASDLKGSPYLQRKMAGDARSLEEKVNQYAGLM